MALKAILDNLDGVPAALQSEYKKTTEGKFVLDVTPVGGFALEDIEGLKSTVGATRKERDDALAKLRVFGDLDPKAAQEAVAKVREWGTLDPKTEAEKIAQAKLDQAKAAMIEENKKILAAEGQKAAGYRTQLEDVLIEAEAVRAITAAGGDEQTIEVLLPHIKGASRLRELANGRLAVEVLDEAGNPKVADAQGNLVKLEQLVVGMKENPKFMRTFPGSGQSGGGAGGGGGGGGGGGAHTISREDASNPAKYRAAKEAAGKAGATLQIAAPQAA